MNNKLISSCEQIHCSWPGLGRVNTGRASPRPCWVAWAGVELTGQGGQLFFPFTWHLWCVPGVWVPSPRTAQHAGASFYLWALLSPHSKEIKFSWRLQRQKPKV